VKDSEQELLKRVQSSDMEAFKTLFEEFQPILFRNVLYRVRDEDLAHDILQETFIKVWQHRGSIKPHLPLLPYILHISTNLIRDHLKYALVRSKYDPQSEPPSASSFDNPEQTARVHILEEKLIRVINTRLPEKCRTVFLLSRFEDKTNNDIAALLGLSPKTVENHITRALKVLRRELHDYF
jgi:RNA polymerase sigma-70 factor (ECF subfamily)